MKRKLLVTIIILFSIIGIYLKFNEFKIFGNIIIFVDFILFLTLLFTKQKE